MSCSFPYVYKQNLVSEVTTPKSNIIQRLLKPKVTRVITFGSLWYMYLQAIIIMCIVASLQIYNDYLFSKKKTASFASLCFFMMDAFNIKLIQCTMQIMFPFRIVKFLKDCPNIHVYFFLFSIGYFPFCCFITTDINILEN